MKLSDLITGDGPADSSAPKKLSQVSASPPSDPETLPSTQGMKPQENVLERLWSGLTGKDSSKAGAVGMGMADPVYGAAQLGARTPLAAQMPEAPLPDLGEEYQKKVAAPAQASVDTQVQQREKSYQQGRPQAGRLGMDWMRLVGNVASPVNLATAAVPGGGAGAGMGLGARLAAGAGRGALAGGMGGAMQPVTQPGNNFASQKARQIGLGAGLGAPLGAAGGAVFGGRPGLTDRGIGQRFAGSVGLPTKGVNAAPDMATLLQHAATVVKDVTQNKDKLRLTTPTGAEVSGRLPVNGEQFAEAIDQGKDRIFRLFDALTRRADTSASTGTSPINKFAQGVTRAQKAEADARTELQLASRDLQNVISGQDSRLGTKLDPKGPGYAQIQSRAYAAVRDANTKYRNAVSALQAANRNASRPWVDLKPVAAELEKLARSPVVQRDFPALAKYAKEKAETYLEDEAASAADAQHAIKLYNSSLKAFYDGPNYETAARASVDAMVVAKLREGVNTMIQNAVGGRYQQLKNLYGSYSALEKQVTRAAMRGMNQSEANAFSRFFNVTSGEEVLRGILTMNPMAITRGVLLRVAKSAERAMNNPDRTIMQMFQGAERAMGGRSTMENIADRIGTGLTTGLGMGLGESSVGMSATDRRRQPPVQVLQ